MVEELAEHEIILRITTVGVDGSRVDGDIDKANQIWGRAGVRIVPGNRVDIPTATQASSAGAAPGVQASDILDAPPSPDLHPMSTLGRAPTDPNRLDLFSPGEGADGRRQAMSEVHSLLEQNQAPANLPDNTAPDELTAYWVPGMEDQRGPLPGRGGQAFDQLFDDVAADGVAIASNASPDVLAHEIAHVVLHQDHVDDEQNLLADGASREGTELNSAQRQAMLASPYVHPVDPLP